MALDVVVLFCGACWDSTDFAHCIDPPPKNSYPRYCSGQWDVDGFFGSVGPFQLFEPLEGALLVFVWLVGRCVFMWWLRASGRVDGG